MLAEADAEALLRRTRSYREVAPDGATPSYVKPALRQVPQDAVSFEDLSQLGWNGARVLTTSEVEAKQCAARSRGCCGVRPNSWAAWFFALVGTPVEAPRVDAASHMRRSMSSRVGAQAFKAVRCHSGRSVCLD